MQRHEKYRVLLTFDDLLKNVKNAILTYNSIRFNGVDSFRRMIVNILFVFRQWRHFILYNFKTIKF